MSYFLCFSKAEGVVIIILDRLKTFVDFYPEHIRREDDVFFPDAEKYFTFDEQ
jgi:hemerythrin-like domain-containing protein